MSKYHDAALACRQLAKHFDDGTATIKVLDNLDCCIAHGERVAIVGASGAGKSTLLHILGGLDQPSSGQIWVNGQSLTDLNEKQKGILRNHTLGFIYQFHHLLPEFNALENVAMPLLIRGIAARDALAKASKLIEKVGLDDRLYHRIGELSGGERQRIAIARALVTDPKCVLADEPTGNLDETTAQQIVELILQLNQQLTTSFVIVTHNMRIAEQMQRTLVLENGQLNPAT